MELRDYIQDLLDELDYVQNPYFQALKSGEFEKDDFLETQIQFYYAVDFFPRPMAALAAKIPTHERRLEILENVFEEHGEGDSQKFHKNTFLELLNRLGGISESDVKRRVLWPEVRHFNSTLVGTCVLDDYVVGVGVMGMIERMFVDISACLGQAVIDRGWLEEDQLIHYNLHKELDIKHSEDFFKLLEEPWEKGEKSRYYVLQGLRLGGYCFYTLYEGLYRNRKTRQVLNRPWD